MLTILLLVTVTVAVVGLLLWPRRPPGGPPGPAPWPIIGTGALVGVRNRDDLFALLQTLPATYGSVVGFYAGSLYTVLMDGLALAVAVLAREETNGRQVGSAQLELSFGARRGLIVAEGDSWSKSSRFVKSTLRRMLQSGEIEAMVRTEVSELVAALRATAEPVSVKELFRERYVSLCWNIITGKRLASDEARNLTDLFRAEMSALKNAWVNNRLLRTVFPERSGFAAVLRFRDAVRAMFAAAVRREPNRSESTFVAQMRATKTDPLWRADTDPDLVMYFCDFVNAGCETTSSFCEWAIVYLLRQPASQQRLREEVSAAGDSAAQLPLAHRDTMSFTRAFEAEVMRLSSFTPAIVPHRALEDADIGGFRIPRHAVVLCNIITTHWSEALWQEPRQFRPERFLADGRFVPSDNLVPYGIGLRRCAGEALAEAYDFLMLTSLVGEFEVTLPPGQQPPTEEVTMGLTRSCLPFQACFRPVGSPPDDLVSSPEMAPQR